MNKYLSSAIIIVFVFNLQLPAQGDITASLDAMAASFAKVETGKATITQSYQSGDAPYMLEFVRETEDLKKGNVERETYKLNLALLDDKTIKRNTKKDEMSVEISTRNSKLINYTKDDDASKYVSDLKIICPDIDAARDVEKYLKEIVEVADKMWRATIVIPNELSGVKARFKDLDGRLQIGDTEIDQRFADVEGYPEFVKLTQIFTKGGKDEFNAYEFNIGDLDKNSYKISNEKELIGLGFKTIGKTNLVQYNTDDKLKFNDDILIYYNTPSDAMVAKELWVKGMELAQAATEKRYDQITACRDCKSQLFEILSTSSRHLNPITASGDCMATIEVADLNKGDDKRYEFHWGDIDPKNVKLDFTGSDQKLKLQCIFKNKFIGIYNKEGIEKYDADISLSLQHPDNAKISILLIDKIIGNCGHTIEASTMEWMADKLTSDEIIDRYTQSFVKEEDNCSYSYGIYDNEKGTEEKYEFNLYDLNDKGVELKISGSKIALDIPTVRNEKVITRYDAKGELKYDKSMEILFADLESARIAELTLKKAIEGCK